MNRRTQRLLSDYHLTIAQFGVMEALYHLGDMKINDIIEKTLSTSGNMTVVIKNLEKDGWIRRYKDAYDGRICMIALEKKGEELIGEIFPKHLEHLAGFFEKLDREEKQQLSQLLKQLNGIEEKEQKS